MTSSGAIYTYIYNLIPSGPVNIVSEYVLSCMYNNEEERRKEIERERKGSRKREIEIEQAAAHDGLIKTSYQLSFVSCLLFDSLLLYFLSSLDASNSTRQFHSTHEVTSHWTLHSVRSRLFLFSGFTPELRTA